MKYRKINGFYIALLLSVALVFDLLSLIPGINHIVMVVGQAVIGVLFYIAGVNVFKNKPAITYILTGILEFIPGASVLPFFLVETLTIIGLARTGKV
jgi:hypothetical protein